MFIHYTQSSAHNVGARYPRMYGRKEQVLCSNGVLHSYCLRMMQPMQSAPQKPTDLKGISTTVADKKTARAQTCLRKSQCDARQSRGRGAVNVPVSGLQYRSGGPFKSITIQILHPACVAIALAINSALKRSLCFRGVRFVFVCVKRNVCRST